MKGVELPINILVVVAIAVIVLLGLVALYFIGFNPFSVAAGTESIKNAGCRTYMNQNDTTGNPSPCINAKLFNVTWKGTSMYFYEFMMRSETYNCPNEDCIRKMCTCPGY